MLKQRYLTLAAACAAAWSGVAPAELLVDFGSDTDDVVRSVRLGPTGNIFADVRRPDGSALRCSGILALDPDGATNTGFDQDGRLALDSCPEDLRVRSDGSLVFLSNVGLRQGYSLRVHAPDGTPVLTSPAFWSYSEFEPARVAGDLALQADGRYLVNGVYQAGRPSFGRTLMIHRLNADGTTDPAMGNGVFVGNSGSSLVTGSLHALSDGKILTSGLSAGTSANRPTVMRLNADGTPDSSFGLNGKFQVTQTSDAPARSVVDASGRIYLVAGQGVVVRVLADGSLDMTYAGGSVRPDLKVSSLALDDMGRAVLFGEQSGVPYVARFDNAGNPDVTFNGTGEVLIPFARPLHQWSSSTDPRCFGVVQSGSRPLLACSVAAEADAGVTPRGDVGFVRLTSAGAPDVTFGAGQASADSYPDAFSFPDVTVPYGTSPVVSAPATIVGFTNAALVEPLGSAQYSIGCSGTYTSSPSTIAPGQTICLSGTASMTAGGSTAVSVRIGGRQGTFTIHSGTTGADFVPDAFAFAAKTGVMPSTLVASDPATITGITGAAPVTVEDGTYSIGCTGSYVTGSGVITNGQTVCVRHFSAATNGTSWSSRLTIGGVSALFTSTTATGDTQPDVFSLNDQVDVAAGSTVVSNVVTITGIDTATSISVTNGEYSIGCNGIFTAAAGMIQPNQSVCVRHTASATPGASNTTTLTVGGMSDNFTTVTAM